MRKPFLRVAALLLCVMIAAAFTGCAGTQPVETLSPGSSISVAIVEATPQNSFAAQTTQAVPPKYIFLFIGDGMSFAQVHAAQVYMGASAGEISQWPLSFTQFPVTGSATTYDATSFIPDSAAAATAMACGIKTKSHILGMKADGETPVPNITELLKADGKKTGIVTSVTLNHATPAAFYAHVATRTQYYEIARQMSESEVDYFGGGSLSEPRGSDNDQTDAFTLLADNGYTIADTAQEIEALDGASGKVYAVSPTLDSTGTLPLAIDAQEEDWVLADFVQTGIDVLDNENGFFMMCEGGEIDWACHANDAAAAIKEVLSFADAVQVAVDFAEQHPDETLIVVTADHETGGMTIGNASGGYGVHFDMLGAQRMSYRAFGAAFADMKTANPALTLEDMLPIIRNNFGLVTPRDAAQAASAAFVLTDAEYAQLKTAFSESMKPKAQRADTPETRLLYGGYDPLTATITHILDNKAGVGWTSYAHTGAPVPVYAMGAGAEQFVGSYDNTELFLKLVFVCGL